jgi:hypothetical protein
LPSFCAPAREITLANLEEARKTVVADPELGGCDLRDSRASGRIAGGVCPFGNDRAAAKRQRMAYCELKPDFCELFGGRRGTAPNHIAVHSDNMVSC